METLADCWSSPSTGKVVMQPVQFVQAVPAVVYSVGYLPQAGIAQPTMWT